MQYELKIHPTCQQQSQRYSQDRSQQTSNKKSLYYVAVPVLLGTPETSLSGLNTLIALSVRRSMRSSSSPTPAAAAAAAASSLLAEAARAAAGSSGVRMVMYLREWADRQCYVTLTQEGQDEQDTQVLYHVSLSWRVV